MAKSWNFRGVGGEYGQTLWNGKSRGVGGQTGKTLRGGGMDIFWNHTFRKTYNVFNAPLVWYAYLSQFIGSDVCHQMTVQLVDALIKFLTQRAYKANTN